MCKKPDSNQKYFILISVGRKVEILEFYSFRGWNLCLTWTNP